MSKARLAMAADEIRVTSPADFHVHLRQDEMCALVTPLVRHGGFKLAYVMPSQCLRQPNLKSPITTTEMAMKYKAELERIDPQTQYLMTLYLSPELTSEEIRKAAKAGIVGVKSYPRGVTTNSEGGIESYEAYYPVFQTMQDVGMVLNLHGEIPSDHTTNTCVLNAEAKFLPHLKSLHEHFPRLRIVLEHATTRAAVEAVKSLGHTIGCSITAHHLALTVDDWAGQAFNFCKPVAKYPDDREALREVIREGHPRFFLGSDSAPHPVHVKSTSTPREGCAAGVFTSSILLPLMAQLLESFGALDKLEAFVSSNGRAFYGIPVAEDTLNGEVVVLKKTGNKEVEMQFTSGKQSVVPFMAGQKLEWEIVN